MRHRFIVACVLSFLLPASTVLADKTAQQYLADGNQYLSSGQFNDALISFDAAIEQDPNNFLSYYRRATAYLSLGRSNAAVDDFTKILDLKPDFDQALLHRARIYAKAGDYSLAKADLVRYVAAHPDDSETADMLKNLIHSEKELEEAEHAKRSGQYDECVSHASSVISAAPQMPRARLLRAHCHLAKGEVEAATGDLTRAAYLVPSDADVILLLAKLNFFSLGEAQGALTQLKQCLHYDPEQKQCKKLFRQIKKVDKDITKADEDFNSKRYATAANKLVGTSTAPGVIQNLDAPYEELTQEIHMSEGYTLPKRLHVKCYDMACRIFGENHKDDKIEQWCGAVLDLQEDNVDALTYIGEIKLKKSDFEAAVRDLDRANEISGGQNHRVRQLLQKAQNLLRQSKRRDYYKILGVSRDVDKREIKKAWRKKAHEWHPDKYTGDLDKDQVERKMAEINQAYEVLGDDEKREQYDNGYDPYDPESAQQGGPGGHPFHHHGGGHPFAHFQGGFPFGGGFPGGGGGGGGGGSGGGPFTFKMQF